MSEQSDTPRMSIKFSGELGMSLLNRIAQLERERDEARAEVERLRSVLLGHVPHVYEGNCPDRVDPTQRDSYCPACRILAATEPKP